MKRSQLSVSTERSQVMTCLRGVAEITWSNVVESCFSRCVLERVQYSKSPRVTCRSAIAQVFSFGFPTAENQVQYRNTACENEVRKKILGLSCVRGILFSAACFHSTSCPYSLFCHLYQRLPNCFLHGGTPKIIFHSPRKPTLWRSKQNKRLLLAHGDYSRISNFRAKLFTMFRGIFAIFFLLSYLNNITYFFTISSGTPKNVLSNPLWKSLI